MIDQMLPEGTAVRDGAHDEVAERILSIQIAMSNKAEKYKEALELLEKALAIVAGTLLRLRIEENRKIIADNLEYKKTYGTCWFCKRNPPDDELSVVKLYKNFKM